MADENSPQASQSPYCVTFLALTKEATGKTVTKVHQFDKTIIFLYSDNTALILAVDNNYSTGESSIEVVSIDPLSHFTFKELAPAGILDRLYIIQQIGKEAGLLIEPVADSDNTFRIDLN